MAEIKKLLEVRKTIKDKKPEFLQQDFHKKKRLSRKWKRPTGLQSKMRHQKKGYGRRVKQGWRSPVEVRGFDRTGVATIVVSSLSQLDTIQKGYAIIVAKSVGTKKRLEILDKADKLKITVINVKADKLRKAVADAKEKKTSDKKLREDKKKSVQEAAKKAEKKKDEKKAEKSEDKSEEDKKKEEKKEKDDVLIHKE